jgi:hypothetical protein
VTAALVVIFLSYALRVVERPSTHPKLAIAGPEVPTDFRPRWANGTLYIGSFGYKTQHERKTLLGNIDDVLTFVMSVYSETIGNFSFPGTYSLWLLGTFIISGFYFISYGLLLAIQSSLHYIGFRPIYTPVIQFVYMVDEGQSVFNNISLFVDNEYEPVVRFAYPFFLIGFLYYMYPRLLRWWYGTVRKSGDMTLTDVHADESGRYVGNVLYIPKWPFSLIDKPKLIRIVISSQTFRDLVVGISETNTPPTSTGKVLEMAVPGSFLEKTKAPKFCGIIHCADPDLTDLHGKIIGVLTRIKQRSGTVGITAHHCLEQITMRQNSGHKVYLNFNGRDYLIPPVDVLTHSPHAGDNLDIAVLHFTARFWSMTGMKAAKFNKVIKVGDIIKVYTPEVNGSWLSSLGTVLNPTTLFKLEHSASTRFGTSGSPLISNGIVKAIHTSRNESKGCNCASSPVEMLESDRIRTETPLPELDLWQEQERHYNEDDEERFERRYDRGFDEDKFAEDLREGYDLDDDYSHVIIYSKQEHREYVSMDHKHYSRAELDDQWMRHRFGDDYKDNDAYESGTKSLSQGPKKLAPSSQGRTSLKPAPNFLVNEAGLAVKKTPVQQDTSNGPTKKAPALPVKSVNKLEVGIGLSPHTPPPLRHIVYYEAPTPLQISTVSLQSVEDVDEERKETTVDPSPHPLNRQGKLSALVKDSLPVISEATSGLTAKAAPQSISTHISGPKKLIQKVGGSSAPPRADSLQRDGKKKKKRRRKKKTASPVSETGIQPTAQPAQHSAPSELKVLEEKSRLLQRRVALLRLAQKSSQNTPVLRIPPDSTTRV